MELRLQKNYTYTYYIIYIYQVQRKTKSADRATGVCWMDKFQLTKEATILEDLDWVP